jgi:hypothetical protein
LAAKSCWKLTNFIILSLIVGDPWGMLDKKLRPGQTHFLNIINSIFEYSKQSQRYTLKYLEVFPAKKIEIDMS